ncbi:MAG: anti-sigma factor [Bryobacteraceae bacterium]|jgi:anti-sigma-K factor RskA
MSCEELRDSFELYALGLLDGEEKSEMDAHLTRGCETCRKALNNALAVNALLLSLPSEVAPPARLRRRLLASVGFQRPRWGWVPALAAVLLLVIAVWLGFEERQRESELAAARQLIRQVSDQRDRMLQAFAFLNQPETQQVGFGKGQPAPPRGNVFVNPRSGVLLIASNLPRLNAGKTYEMWVIPKGGAPRPAGLFQSTEAGTAFHILSGPVEIADLGAVAVTVEPESGSPAPTSTPIIAAAF